jgi:hypothetical protein
MKSLSLLALALSITLGECKQASPRDKEASALRKALKAVTLGDGVSQSEADLIARCYFNQNVGCGQFTGIRDGGDTWIVDGVFGYRGRPIVGFEISKTSGKITSPDGPSYATPFQIFP